VKNPALVIVPPLAGFTDQVKEPPSGRLGVNSAVNVVVEPGLTVIEEGLTEIVPGAGEEGELPLGELWPQPARASIIKGCIRAIRLRRIMIASRQLVLSPEHDSAIPVQLASNARKTSRRIRKLDGDQTSPSNNRVPFRADLSQKFPPTGETVQ